MNGQTHEVTTNARSCSLRRARRAFRGARRPDDHPSRPTPSSGLSATCICGSDLWPYRGINPVAEPTPMGHEYCGIVEEVGTRGHVGQAGPVRHRLVLRVRQHLPALPAPATRRRASTGNSSPGAQAPLLRVPLADGTLVATPDVPPDELHPEPAGALRRDGHRLVRRRRRQRASRARRSPSSATARSACSACSRRSRWAPSGSSR